MGVKEFAPFSQRHGLCQVEWELNMWVPGFYPTPVSQSFSISLRLTWHLYPARWSPRVVHLGLLMRMNKLYP